MIHDPNLFLSVGKQVKDEYERVIGKVASFALTPSGRFDSVFIELGDGRFVKHPVENLTLDGSDITLISHMKSRAVALCDQIPLLWRKDQALKDLVEKKKISPELHQELHKSFDGALGQLKNEAQDLSKDMEKEAARCTEEIRELNYALVNLEIEHEIGKVDDQNYGTAFTIIQENLKRANVEKSDLEITKSKLSNILLGDSPRTIGQEAGKPPSKVTVPVKTGPELPEPPVVVYVKEIGKTGI